MPLKVKPSAFKNHLSTLLQQHTGELIMKIISSIIAFIDIVQHVSISQWDVEKNESSE